MRFKVYQHGYVIKDNLLVNRQFIVLQDDNKLLHFTDFHKYIKNPDRKAVPITDDGNNRFSFVCKLLNYCFFCEGITALNQITVEMVSNFLNDYGMCSLPDDDEFTTRAKPTVDRCIEVITDFLFVLIKEKQIPLKYDDLFEKKNARDKYGKAYDKKVLKFQVNYVPTVNYILRDMPNRAFDILYTHFLENHKDMIMLISNQSFAGLRPSESCNVRRVDSPLGPGIIFDEYDGIISSIEIDLKHEYNLRADFIPVGQIKKERVQQIPPIFINAYYQAYKLYMDYMKDKKYDKNFGPLSVNMQGNAVTYASYSQKFREIVRNEVIPLFLEDEDPEVVEFGRILCEYSISPHIFRHWYTVQLVLNGAELEDLMEWRGDSSPESALVYINNKGELIKKYRKVNNEIFDYLSWLAGKKYDD